MLSVVGNEITQIPSTELGWFSVIYFGFMDVVRVSDVGCFNEGSFGNLFWV